MRHTPQTRPVRSLSLATWLAAAAIVITALLTSPVSAEKARANAGKRRVRNPIILDRIVAVVNDAIILRSELMVRTTPLLADLQNITNLRERKRRRKKLTHQVLDDIINEELMIQAAVEAKLSVSPKEITKALDGIKSQNKLDNKGLAKALALQGFTIGAYRKVMKRQIMRMRAINQLVRRKVAITDEDVRAKYDAMNRRSASVSKVRLHHVLIAVPRNPSVAQIAEAKRKASAVIAKSKTGTKFAELAKTYSDDPNTKNDAGDLGWIDRGSIPTEWEVVVFAMEKNEVRGPISGTRGFHVFYVSDLKKNKVKAFKDVKEKLRNDLYRRELDKQTRTWLDDLRKKAYIQRKVQ